VPLTTFEKLLSPSKMTIGVKQGLGCYPESFPEDDRKAGAVPDQFRHEIATIYTLAGSQLFMGRPTTGSPSLRQSPITRSD
jgi:7,8-dihydropterin-6-yl-methyl-4-(beta-D-ribofuranosyl)aminobenzene 5'-phosphate synthase